MTETAQRGRRLDVDEAPHLRREGARPGPGSAPTPAAMPAANSPAVPAPGLGEEPDAAALDAAWDALPGLALDPRHLRRSLIVTAGRTDPAHGAFDVLRTRLLAEMNRRGWRRLGITSPTKGCGKTFTSVNLAVTLSRLGGVRTLLLDLDMRQPALARAVGAPGGLYGSGSIGDMLRGLRTPEAALTRVVPGAMQLGRLALGLNGRREPFAAELVRDARTARALLRAEELLRPGITLLDLPPALAQDDVLALRPHYDALLMVAGGGQTTPRELKEAVRRLGPDAPILGVVLNKAEGEDVADYAYDYD